MDIYVKKEDLETDIAFDIIISNNDLLTDDTIVTATLMSILTDGSRLQIGTQIDGKIVGNPYYNIEKLSEINVKNYKLGLEQSLKWLIDSKIVQKITVEVQKKSNILLVNITLLTEKENDLNLIFSLDENLQILDK